MLSIGKLVVLAGIIALVYFFLIRKPSKEDRSGKEGKPPSKNDNEMVACHKCGTYVSPDEAIIKDGRFYCSKQCAGLE